MHREYLIQHVFLVWHWVDMAFGAWCILKGWHHHAWNRKPGKSYQYPVSAMVNCLLSIDIVFSNIWWEEAYVRQRHLWQLCAEFRNVCWYWTLDPPRGGSSCLSESCFKMTFWPFQVDSLDLLAVTNTTEWSKCLWFKKKLTRRQGVLCVALFGSLCSQFMNLLTGLYTIMSNNSCE